MAKETLRPDLKIQLFDKHSMPRTCLDFAKLDCSPDMAETLRDTFVLEAGHLSLQTQLQVWRCVRKFGTFLGTQGAEMEKVLPFDLLIRWQEWLSSQELQPSTKQTAMTLIAQHCNSIARNKPERAPDGFNQTYSNFRRQEPAKLSVLNKDDLNAIVAACQTEIKEVEARIQTGKDALAGRDTDPTLCQALRLIFGLRPDGLCSQKDVLALPRATRNLVSRAGGLRYLSSLLYLSSRDLIGYYILILAQTGGNPMAIRELRRDCVTPHPLRSDLCQVTWDKPRAGREQRADFPVNQSWAAPALIRRLAAINENLVHLTDPGHEDYLFLFLRGGKAAVPIHQMLHLLLDKFIERRQLPQFEFKQLRSSGATLVFSESENLKAVQGRLNHRQTRSTTPYVDQTILTEQLARTIRRFQGELIELSVASQRPADHADDSVQRSLDFAPPAQTVFGFSCKDPFAGVAPGSTRGSPCAQFAHCATCPGAIVTLDDAVVVAKLLATHQHLTELAKRAIAEGWSRRYDHLYRPTLSVIEHELLPAVSESIRDDASKRARAHPLPFLD